MTKVINKTKGHVVETIMSADAQVKQLKEQLAALKAAGAGRFGVWTSEKTGKKYLNFKPKQGKSFLLTRSQVEEIVNDSKTIIQACSELGID